MVKIFADDMFQSKSQTLTNAVNCVGVMGKGIAFEFKKRFPEMHEDYLRRCKSKQVKLGRPYIFKTVTTPWIINFPTKEHWQSPSRLADIIRGMKYLEKYYQKWGITSLALPALGCGEGQLRWEIVGPVLYHHFMRFSIPIELYAPLGTPKENLEFALLKTKKIL